MGADLQSGWRWETPEGVQARRKQVEAGLLLSAQLNQALHTCGVAGDEAGFPPGYSEYCLSISRYKKGGMLLQYHVPVHDT